MSTSADAFAPIRLRNDHGTAVVFRHGAHVASWVPAGGHDVLWMSPTSRFSSGRPIRGGIPLCFPWFGIRSDEPDAPQHGLVRTVPWRVDGVTESRVSLVLDEASVAQPFVVRYDVELRDVLELTLTIQNAGDRDLPWQAMLHTYFAVRDAGGTTVHGLEGVPYVPKGAETVKRDAGAVRIVPGISRRYHDVAGSVTIVDGARRIRVDVDGGQDAVLWNPGPDIAAGFDDFPPREWARMVCFETGSLTGGPIPGGGIHRIRTTLRYESGGDPYQS